MPVQHVHSFLVNPAKNIEEQPVISGTEIHSGTKIHTMLSGVFERSHRECNIEIVFRANEEGRQQNDCRDLLIAYANAPTIPHGRAIASRLQGVTTLRSGLGLLFLIKGEVDDVHQVVISRFPADEGVLAEENARRLEVKFIERIFMKNAKTYKSAFYSSESLLISA